MGKEITPFSIMPLTKHSPLLLRHIHFRHDHLSSKFDHLPSNVFDYDVCDGENVVGRIYFQDHLVAERWFWSITGSAVRDEHGAASGSAATLSAAKIAFAAAWEHARESLDS